MKNNIYVVLFVLISNLFMSCDPLNIIYVNNSSPDTLYVRVHDYILNSRIKVKEFYPDSTRVFEKRAFIYVLPSGQKMEIGSKIGWGKPHETDIRCDSLIIESKNLKIVARNKEAILKLIEGCKSENEYEFIIR